MDKNEVKARQRALMDEAKKLTPEEANDKAMALCAEIKDKKGVSYLGFVLDVCTLNSARQALREMTIPECMDEITGAMTRMWNATFDYCFEGESIEEAGDYAQRLFALGSVAGELIAKELAEKHRAGATKH